MIFASEKLSRPQRYAIGLALALAALALQWTLALAVGQRIPFLLFIPTLALSAVLLGRGPALIVFITGLLHGAMILAPMLSMAIDSPADRISLLAYAGVGMLSILLGNKVKSIARRALQAEQALFAERLQGQEAAREKDARFRLVIDTSPVPFSILTPMKDETGKVVDFRWTYLNRAAAEAAGKPLEELSDKPVSLVLPAIWENPGLFDSLVAVSQSGASQSFELRLNADDQEAWFQVIASCLHEQVVVWFANITEQKVQERTLQEADQRKDEFLATLAHELRNPLAPIRQAAALSKLDSLSEDRRRWSSEVIERQVRNMALLLDDLLDVSRITCGSLTLRKSMVEVRAVLEAAIETVRPQIEARHHRLVLTLPPNPIFLHVDPLRVAQVVANLLANAAKYTDRAGRIELAAHRIGEEILISVTDNGVGIRPEKLGEIFNMFSHASVQKDPTQGGLGIGLALSKGLAQMHGGHIEAESAGPGRGSRFTLHLPLDLGHDAPASLETAPPEAPRQARRVLIADDNRDAADTLASLVELEGHDVKVAYDGAAAVAVFHEFQPDIALLDLGMPKLSGIEVARHIRSSEKPQAILVAVTGWGQESDRAKTREAGFDEHLTKPIDTERLRQLLTAEPVI